MDSKGLSLEQALEPSLSGGVLLSFIVVVVVMRAASSMESCRPCDGGGKGSDAELKAIIYQTERSSAGQSKVERLSVKGSDRAVAGLGTAPAEQESHNLCGCQSGHERHPSSAAGRGLGSERAWRERL